MGVQMARKTAPTQRVREDSSWRPSGGDGVTSDHDRLSDEANRLRKTLPSADQYTQPFSLPFACCRPMVEPAENHIDAGHAKRAFQPPPVVWPISATLISFVPPEGD
uniref:Uncharacterized protein n=1 Tax=Plectus sambesii TaxID=2011161 RepID=A0A914WPI3_9BILA